MESNLMPRINVRMHIVSDELASSVDDKDSWSQQFGTEEKAAVYSMSRAYMLHIPMIQKQSHAAPADFCAQYTSF